MSLGLHCDTADDIEERDYEIAEGIGRIVMKYVEGVIQATERLLECLPEVAYVRKLEGSCE